MLHPMTDLLKEELRRRHIVRLQRGECSIVAGFIWSDLLTALERVGDHCSNIAGCVIEISRFDALDMHEYLNSIKNDGNGEYKERYNEYSKKYAL